MKNFILFGQHPFNAYTCNRFNSIASNINSMSDIEILMYENNVDELIKKLVKSYSLLPVTISFEDKLIDLITMEDETGLRYFVEYTLMISGDSVLLTLDPYNLGYVSLTLPVSVKTNVISFEIDTHEYTEHLSRESMKFIKSDYETIRDFIATTLLNLNNESQKFNLQLEEFIIPILTDRIRLANNHSVLKQKLDFK